MTKKNWDKKLLMKVFLSIAIVLIAPCLGKSQQTATVTLSWNTVAIPAGSPANDTVSYNAFRWTTGQNGFQKLNTTPILTGTYDDKTAVVGKTYSYYVTAVDTASTKESVPSTQVDALVIIITVPAPIGLKVDKITIP